MAPKHDAQGALSHYPGQLLPPSSSSSSSSSSIYGQQRMTLPASYFPVASSSASSSLPLPPHPAPSQQQHSHPSQNPAAQLPSQLPPHLHAQLPPQLTPHLPPQPEPQHHQRHQDQPDYDSYTEHVPLPPSQHRASSGAWSPQNDHQLVAARMQGLNWGQIKDAYFPSKTANACRKRHERLMERRGAEDWDHRKLQRLAKEYMSMRREIWSGLAARTGERWNVVEYKCMSNGLKNLQSAARAASRRDRLETSSHHVPGYDDDSGISGIALTPVDELDASYNSSPETSSANNGVLLHGLAGHGYSSSVSSTASGAVIHRRFTPGRGPYVDGQRMPDMGIGAIINRPSR
ncbi:hypothetical protein L249_5595 [Ophiocordyceps polyrhachis-furcata BCC 54312]|uniref:Myb-like domain-containing protein n=1 Tax=Ophiocordyceps polyrhachis-furcata BCC 54312 TaxID=1330021 RepID=A0A367LGE4_9HYPO|nr:hypothetical protein L249_5595 [Ophiocordyceps polyrhachis-furcata BCC 54312]